MINTRIISAFPGTGKSYICNNPEVIGTGVTFADSDSSEFSWVKGKEGVERNPNFISDYMDHIKGNIGKVDYIFVSSHSEVRKALRENCLFFYLFYPDACDKPMYLKKYKNRNSPKGFINIVDKNWDTWINECRKTTVGCKNFAMGFTHLSDEILMNTNITKAERIKWDIP